jgi:carbonic anhydrase
MKRTLLLSLLTPKGTLRPLIIVITLALSFSLLAASGTQRKAGSQAETAQPQPSPSPCPPTGVNADSAETMLKNGNGRWRATMETQNWARARAATATCQSPFAVVVTCMDSRVPPELIFDQTLGKLFVIRVAGPVLNDDELASLEYALVNMKVKLVVVLGHTDCGAVKGAVDRAAGNYLPELLCKIEPAITEVSNKYNEGNRIDSKNPTNLNRVSLANAKIVALRIPDFGQRGVKVKWGLYDTGTGSVTLNP